MTVYDIKKGDKCDRGGCKNKPTKVVLRLAIVFIYCDEHYKKYLEGKT